MFQSFNSVVFQCIRDYNSHRLGGSCDITGGTPRSPRRKGVATTNRKIGLCACTHCSPWDQPSLLAFYKGGFTHPNSWRVHGSLFRPTQLKRAVRVSASVWSRRLDASRRRFLHWLRLLVFARGVAPWAGPHFHDQRRAGGEAVLLGASCALAFRSRPRINPIRRASLGGETEAAPLAHVLRSGPSPQDHSLDPRSASPKSFPNRCSPRPCVLWP